MPIQPDPGSGTTTLQFSSQNKLQTIVSIRPELIVLLDFKAIYPGIRIIE
jgi:hypothetical protein